ncbi:MAG TPA: hypothetical protein VHK06_03995 [Candidatus Limnocylindria bacterium]|nr:hypothetical protein [Candidatus Limnocylindria bacterium]
MMRRISRWRLGVVVVAVCASMGFSAVWTNALGAGDRFDRLLARIELVLDPPPDRPTLPTVVVTPAPRVVGGTPRPTIESVIGAVPPGTRATPEPTPTPAPVRAPVDVSVVSEPAAVFASQLTNEWCAVAATQMVLTIHGLGNTSEAFQRELAGRIGEWESWDDSHDGGWGPAAIAEALAAYGATGYEIRAYASRDDALRDSAIALSRTGRPVVLLPWWGAHTWVMTGYRADADPLLFPDARVSGLYILDPWYPRVSNIWGPSDPPGNFEDAAEMERNFIPWSRPEGAYPGRDGMFIVVVPMTP